MIQLQAMRLLRAGEAENDAPLPGLRFQPIDLEGECLHGTYYVRRAGEGWEAKLRPKGWRLDERERAIDAIDAQGGRLDWPSRACAEEACRLHADLVELGHGVHRAAELVGLRAQQLIREWQAQSPQVLDYAAAGARP